jgi:hypothetical protein
MVARCWRCSGAGTASFVERCNVAAVEVDANEVVGRVRDVDGRICVGVNHGRICWLGMIGR